MEIEEARQTSARMDNVLPNRPKPTTVRLDPKYPTFLIEKAEPRFMASKLLM
jgi:hypothetical protein